MRIIPVVRSRDFIRNGPQTLRVGQFCDEPVSHDGRRSDCDYGVWNNDLLCWPCYRDRFDVPNMGTHSPDAFATLFNPESLHPEFMGGGIRSPK